MQKPFGCYDDISTTDDDEEDYYIDQNILTKNVFPIYQNLI